MDTRERKSYLRQRLPARHGRTTVSSGLVQYGGTIAPRRAVNSDPMSSSLVVQHAQYVDSLVQRIMKEFNLASIHKDDLTGAAYLGLVEAAERFDPSHGSNFKAFSFLRIRGAIIDYMRDNSVIPHSLNRRIKAFVAASNLREGISLETDSLSLVEKQRVVVELIGDYALIMRLSMESATIVNKPDSGLGPDDLVDQKMRGSTLRRLINELSPPERLVISKYYLEDKKFSEIVGLRRGFTKSWVCRLHRRGIESLRKLVLATKDRLGEEPSEPVIKQLALGVKTRVAAKRPNERRGLKGGIKRLKVGHKIKSENKIEEPNVGMGLTNHTYSIKPRYSGDSSDIVSNRDPTQDNLVSKKRDMKRTTVRRGARRQGAEI